MSADLGRCDGREDIVDRHIMQAATSLCDLCIKTEATNLCKQPVRSVQQKHIKTEAKGGDMRSPCMRLHNPPLVPQEHPGAPP